MSDTSKSGLLKFLVARFLDNALDEEQAKTLFDFLTEPTDDRSRREQELLEQLTVDVQLKDLGRNQGRFPSALDLLGQLDAEGSLFYRKSQRVGFGVDQASSLATDSPNIEALVRLTALSPSVPPEATAPPLSTGKPKSLRSRKAENAGNVIPTRWMLILIPFLFCLGIYHEFTFRPQSSGTGFIAVARVVESIEAEWEETAEIYKKGQELEPSRMRLKSGVVKLEFAGGAQIVLEGPTDFLVRDKNGAFCQQGRLSVFVPPRAAGFEIASPLVTVVDLGTAFSMRVSDDKSEVHVLHGKVEIQPPRKEKVLLFEGFASFLDLRDEPKTVPVDANTFLSDDHLRLRKQVYVEKRRGVWVQQQSRMESDPALIYRLEPDTISGLRKSVGSRDDKKAVAFRQSHDRADFSLGKECRSLTLVASVCLDDMRNAANTLLMGNDFYTTPGTIHWQVNGFGILQFHVSDGRSALFFDSDRVFHREHYKTWTTLALVVDADGKTITHYLDGLPVKTVIWDDPVPLKLNQLALGNEWSGSRRKSNRFFHGAMEDFWIFDRPLSAREIMDFHKNNQ